MEITLTPELERFIADDIADGAFQTPEEMALALLTLYREKKMAYLRREIQIGIDSVEKYGSFPMTDEFMAELEAEIEADFAEERAANNEQASGEPSGTGRLENGRPGNASPEQIGIPTTAQ